MSQSDKAEQLEKLEKVEHTCTSVDSTLDNIHRILASKSLFHSWDLVVDYLLNLEMVTRETKHPKAGFYSAVSSCKREGTRKGGLFWKYIKVLFGDKDQEKVVNAMHFKGG